MKKVPLTSLLFGLLFTTVFAQQEKHYYVVVGGFARLSNAVRLTDQANKEGFSAQYAFREDRKLYYVYLLDTPDKRKAFAFQKKIVAETEYKTAWVYIGVLGLPTAEPAVVKNEPPPQLPKETVREEKSEPAPVVPAFEEVAEPVEPEVPVAVEVPVLEEPKKPAGTPFYFKLTNGDAENLYPAKFTLSTQDDQRSIRFFLSMRWFICKGRPAAFLRLLPLLRVIAK